MTGRLETAEDFLLRMEQRASGHGLSSIIFCLSIDLVLLYLQLICTNVLAQFNIQNKINSFALYLFHFHKSIQHQQIMINFLPLSPDKKLSLQLLKKQRYSINLPIIRKMSNNDRNKISIFDLKTPNISPQKSGQLPLNRDRKKQNLIRSQQLQQMKTVDKQHEQQTLKNNQNIGFRQQFIAEVKKLSNMVLIYDLKKKNKTKSMNKRRKVKIQDQSSTQFYPKSKRRYKTIDEYCQNLPLKCTEGKDINSYQQSKKGNSPHQNQMKQFNRYVKLSKLKDLKVELYKDERRNQIEEESVLISKSKSEGRSQIPTPSNIIIDNLRNYMKKKNEKFISILQLGLVKNDQKRNHKEFFSKNFIPHQNSLNESKKKIHLSYVNSILKCSSITKQSNRNFDLAELQTPENLYGQNKFDNEQQSSNLIRKRKSQKFYTIDSKNIRNGDSRRGKKQNFGTSRVENQQKIFKNEQIRRRHYTFDGEQQRRARLKQLSQQTILHQQKELVKQKSVGIIKKQKYEHKICTDRQQNEDKKKKPKDQKNELMLTQSINQWPFKSTSSEHFNQYFFNQKQQIKS